MNDELRNKIYNLSAEELKLVFLKLSNSFEAFNREKQNEGSKQLVAYVIPKKGFDLEDFQLKLKESLPDYMIPSKIKQIEEFPKLPNGKVDYRTLRDSSDFEAAKTSEIKKPNNEIEEQLVMIWEEVLNFSPISTKDNFFEIGGDSILSIQIIAKARKKGIQLSPNQLFEHQTISELALFSTLDIEEDSDQVVFGEVDLTPIQHWFFEVHENAPQYWNQIVEVKRLEPISFECLKVIVNELVDYHDALRTKFTRKANNWKAKIPESNSATCCFYFSLENNLNVQEQNKEIKELIINNQEECDLAKDSLFRTLFFECGEIQSDKIYLIAHHLVIDMVSWNIVKNDFNSGLEQIEGGKKIEFGTKSDSFRSWSTKLQEVSDSKNLRDEIPYWNKQSKWQRLPKGFNPDFSIKEESYYTAFAMELSIEDTRVLLNDSNKAFNTKVEDLLLAALLKTICNWSNSDQLQLGLERHGRTSGLNSLNISNTVGWFTSYFPLTLNLDIDSDIAHLIKSTKEQLRKIPNEGVGFGVLKYLAKEWPQNDNVNKEPELLFNYLGKEAHNNVKDKLSFETMNTNARHPKSEYVSSIELNSMIVNEKLVVNWNYCHEQYDSKTINLLAIDFNENLKSILAVCVENKNFGYTPSDFPEAEINQEDLDNLLNKI